MIALQQYGLLTLRIALLHSHRARALHRQITLKFFQIQPVHFEPSYHRLLLVLHAVRPDAQLRHGAAVDFDLGLVGQLGVVG